MKTESKNPLIGLNSDQYKTEEKADKELSDGEERLNSNSNPRVSQLQRHADKHLGFFERNFRGFEKGSLRVVVITWIRMTMGIGVMTIPNYFSKVGVLAGNIGLIITAILCYLSFGLFLRLQLIII